MGSIFTRKGTTKLYAKLKGVDRKWKQVPTGHDDTPEGRKQAERWLADMERKVETERAVSASTGDINAPLTVRAWVKRWIEDRRKLGLDWKHDRGRLEHHVLPIIGNMLVRDVRTRHIVDLFTRIRTTPSAETGEPLAQRTVYNVYSVVSALFRDAKLADLIDQSPCCLTDRQLGPKRDKNPEWRESAVFDRGEAQTIISTHKIPEDRRVAYAIELLAGLRPGESAALRWRHYDPNVTPLGKMLVAIAYSTKRNVTKGTKTETVKHVPVHPTLAAILGEWKLAGWERMMGRPPQPDDLIIPIPPGDAAARTKRATDEPFRTYYYAGRRWRDEDQPALGWRHRRHYDMRATFITLALEDGADPHVIETRVTHTKKSRSAFDGYNRGKQWAITCAEVAKLQLSRVRDADDNVIVLPVAAAANSRDPDRCTNEFGAVLVQSENLAAMSASSGLPGLAGSKNFESEFVLDLYAYRKRNRPRELKLPPVVHHLRLAESFQHRLESGEVPTRAALARQHGLTRARVTQLLDLLKLDPVILDYVRALPAGTPERMVTEKTLRRIVRLAAPLQTHEAERNVAGFAAHRIGLRSAG